MKGDLIRGRPCPQRILRPVRALGQLSIAILQPLTFRPLRPASASAARDRQRSDSDWEPRYSHLRSRRPARAGSAPCPKRPWQRRGDSLQNRVFNTGVCAASRSTRQRWVHSGNGSPPMSTGPCRGHCRSGAPALTPADVPNRRDARLHCSSSPPAPPGGNCLLACVSLIDSAALAPESARLASPRPRPSSGSQAEARLAKRRLPQMGSPPRARYRRGTIEAENCGGAPDRSLGLPPFAMLGSPHPVTGSSGHAHETIPETEPRRGDQRRV